MNVDRVATVVEQLRELAGPGLYQHNAFRLAGLPTDADARAVRERRRKVTRAQSVGVPIAVSGELPVQASPDEVRAAFDVLQDARRRIVHELFWFWGVADGRCGCQEQVHEEHDRAVRAHANALDVELRHGEVGEADQWWIAAAASWNAMLCRTEFWGHVRHRIQELDDRQLDEASLDAIRADLPRTLLASVAELAMASNQPERLIQHLARWDVDEWATDDALAEAAEPALRQADQLRERAVAALDQGDPRSASDAAFRVRLELVRMERLGLSNGRVRGLREATATLLNNCGVAHLDLDTSDAEIAEMFSSARELTTDEEMSRAIAANELALRFRTTNRSYQSSVQAPYQASHRVSYRVAAPADWKYAFAMATIQILNVLPYAAPIGVYLMWKNGAGAMHYGLAVAGLLAVFLVLAVIAKQRGLR